MKKPTQAQIIRVFLLGFPVGIFLLGAIFLLVSEVFTAEKPPPTTSLRPVREGGPTPIAKHELIAHVDTLARKIGERHAGKAEQLNSAKFYLQSTLGPNNIGYKVAEQTYLVDGQPFTNLEAQVNGTKWPEELVIVGAHYDSAPGTPGADDNASGVAALLTLAKAFAGSPQQRSIRFVAFTNEEPPFFQDRGMGSYEYAKAQKQAGAKILAMISLESVGYYSDAPGSQKYPPQLADKFPDTGNFLGIVSNPANKPLAEFAHASAARTNLMPVEMGAFPEGLPGVGWSDHWSFWQFGYPAIMITDTAIYRNPNYHKASDTPDTIDFERLLRATETTRQLLLDLANAPKDSSFKS